MLSVVLRLVVVISWSLDFTVSIDVKTLVDDSETVVHCLHEPLGVTAKVKSLHRVLRLVPLEGVVFILASRDEGLAWTFVSDVFVAAHDPTVSVVFDQAVSEVELELALTDLARVLERLELHDFEVIEIELNL